MSQHYGTGRRKTSVARVFLRPGTGKFIVNQREASEFFTRDLYLIQINAPLAAAEKQGKFDVFATVKGGGQYAAPRCILAAGGAAAASSEWTATSRACT